jgi:hypothetical protein
LKTFQPCRAEQLPRATSGYAPRPPRRCSPSPRAFLCCHVADRRWPQVSCGEGLTALSPALTLTGGSRVPWRTRVPAISLSCPFAFAIYLHLCLTQSGAEALWPKYSGEITLARYGQSLPSHLAAKSLSRRTHWRLSSTIGWTAVRGVPSGKLIREWSRQVVCVLQGSHRVIFSHYRSCTFPVDRGI